MISILQNEVERLRPASNELAMDIEAFLNSGGTIQVLEVPPEKPRVRYEPPPSMKKPAQAKAIPKPLFVDKMTLREKERAERQAMASKERAALVESIKALAKTMNYAEVIERTGLSRKKLYLMASRHGFSFKPAEYRNGADKRRGLIDDAHDVKTAERIKAFKEIGLSRTQAVGRMGITYTTFNRILDKFGIDYPKRTKGPAPAFFAKPAQQE
ncbi:hypothetical protein AO239_12200 [Pseudomonas sp. ICMP 19500]|jgi:transposase|uniref:hypothetical protein n=2 Tax=Pseudomonas TaxID=286 RepID=UPI00072FF171|nr:hypothetical protein [Pseudomonas sp. PS01856]KTC27969.1 hypothetical protein AO239_12200 [Pseudomonas sp. ICMP 19500]